MCLHVKGQELAARNVHADPPRNICYACSNRGECHLDGKDAKERNSREIMDSLDHSKNIDLLIIIFYKHQ
ncbi:MAG: hypothetical protein ACMUIU_15700 [bacterium]